MAGLTPEQKHVRDTIVRIGRKRHESPMEIKAAIETGLVEANLTNPSGHTDHDSQGWRQERDSLYDNTTDLTASVNRFYDETSAVQGKYHTAGALAAAVQRPAAQYRGRYQDRSAEADRILRGIGALGGSEARSGSARGRSAGGRAITVDIDTPKTTEQFDEAAFEAAKKRSILGAYLTKHDYNNPLLRAGVLSADAPNPNDFTTTSTTTETEKFTIPGSGSSTPAGGGGGSSSAGGLATMAERRADTIDAKHMPYLWGGGHGAKITNVKNATPLDCSGAVSAVLGIDPRVSGGFEKWGRPGDGGNQGVTVYANDHHVLMKINGKFFGTSGTNPGGGAGWIPASALSKDYLKGFTVRHSER